MDLAERIAALTPWHYRFELPGGLVTPLAREVGENRHAHRHRYCFEPLVSTLGGSLAGKRVLDLGCNAGWWALAASRAGAAHVHGIDGRTLHIEQARFVFEALGIPSDRYSFEVGNVLSADLGGPYDLVMCLGLLYHVMKPMELLERIAAVNTDLLLIDTALSTLPGGAFELMTEAPETDNRASMDAHWSMKPTRQAVLDLTAMVGYRAVVLAPRQVTDWKGLGDLRDGRRRAFVCGRKTDPRTLGLDVEGQAPRLGLVRRLRLVHRKRAT